MEKGSCDIFLSYASEDLAHVNRIKEQLETKGYRVYLDTLEILGGDNIVESVFRAIANCRYFAIFLTPCSVRSRWVREELSKAKIRELEGSVVLLPLLYEDCTIPDALTANRYIDFRPEFQRGMEELEKALRAHETRQDGVAWTLGVPEIDERKLGDNKARLVKVLNGQNKLCIAMDLGGTKAYISLMNEEAERFFDKKFSTVGHDDPERLFGFIKESIRQAIDAIHEASGISLDCVQNRIAACGIAFAGPTDFEQGIILGAPNLGISNFHLIERLQSIIKIPTFIDNDVNLGVLGEAWKGVAKDQNNVVGVIIGTGIGGGVIIDGRIYRGSSNTAGEIGHMVIDVDSEFTCPCGQQGCFEALASRKSMARDIHDLKFKQGDHNLFWEPRNLGTNDIVNYYIGQDADTIAVVEQAARMCGKAAVSILNVFDPDMIFFGGGFIKQLDSLHMSEVFLRPIQAEARKRMGAGEITITTGALDNPMLTGACKMAMDNTTGRKVHDKAQLMKALTADLDELDLQILLALYHQEITPRIAGDPSSDLHKDRLRTLRNRGLIETEPGKSFKSSKKVRISSVGRIVVEDSLL